MSAGHPNEGMVRRGRRDAHRAAGTIRFQLSVAVLGAVAVYIAARCYPSSAAAAPLAAVAAVLVCFGLLLLFALARAPIKQRDEARRVRDDDDAKLLRAFSNAQIKLDTYLYRRAYEAAERFGYPRSAAAWWRHYRGDSAYQRKTVHKIHEGVVGAEITAAILRDAELNGESLKALLYAFNGAQSVEAMWVFWFAIETRTEELSGRPRSARSLLDAYDLFAEGILDTYEPTTAAHFVESAQSLRRYLDTVVPVTALRAFDVASGELEPDSVPRYVEGLRDLIARCREAPDSDPPA